MLYVMNEIWSSRIDAILVPRASVSFGHVVGETEGSGHSHYRMSVNHGHPVTHA